MLVPLNWLREYVNDNLPTAELADKLTFSGLSVEQTLHIGTGLNDLIVGLVEDVYPHPNADRLRLARVNIGNKTVEVVCGATNLAAGQHIVYAGEGAHIPVNMHDEQRQPFTLTKAKIRGIESQGMICSVAEMGLGEDHEGILVLPVETKIGQKVTEALDYPQIVFDVEVTTNRSDELSMLGIAREVSVLSGRPLTPPEIKKPIVVNKSGGVVPIIQTPHCFRLMTQQLKVTIGPSPWWMQQRLSLAGMRPINNIVDITNYVMLEYGQPLHAYDMTQLAGDKLIARQAEQGEKITTLDGIERQLASEMMVISDTKTILGIAGIMGGEASKTTSETTQIVLEAAAFDPISIRKTANQLALRSEASRRFERSVDREMTEIALARAVDLMVKHANAQVLSASKDSYPSPLESKQVTLHAGKLNQYLGQQADPSQVRTILKSLGFSDASAFGNETEWEIAVRVPSWRAHDVQEEVDLIEEVVRIVGYNELPASLPDGALPATPINTRHVRKQHVIESLAHAGWTEIISVSLVGESLIRKLEMPMPEINLANPLSSEWTHLRSSLIPGLIRSAADNIRWARQLTLFELGTIYQKNNQTLPQEETWLGFILCSQKSPEQALAEIKGITEHSLHSLGVTSDKVSYSLIGSELQPFEPRHAASIKVQNKERGRVGLLSKAVSESLRLPESTFIAEINIHEYLKRTDPHRLQPIPTTPSLEEDISVVATEETPVARIIEIVMESGKPHLEATQMTQIYRHANLGSNMKSVTLHLIYRDPERTLQSSEVEHIRKQIARNLEQEGLHVRD